MTRIAQHTMVDIPFDDIPMLAERYLESLPHNERVGTHVVLRAWGLECEVLLKMSLVRTYPGLDVLEIQWRPLGDAPYPHFKGTLCAEQEDAGSCRLDLDGEYVPPGGIAGAAFDAVVGHRIAAESIREFLEALKSGFERLHAEGARHRHGLTVD